MSLAIGALASSSIQATSAIIMIPAATGGTTPYSYNLYRSTVSGFSVGSGNIIQSGLSISGASLAVQDSGLTPGTIYYYKANVTDSAGSPATVVSAQLSLTTLAPSLSQNQFSQSSYLGMVDQAFDYNTLVCQVDASQSGSIVAGAAVKFATTAGGVPKVVACTAEADQLAGFVNFSIKDQSFVAGQALSISMAGNVLYLYAALAINRGNQVVSLPSGVAGGCNGGVVPASGTSGSMPIAGIALDTVAIGQLCRILVLAPQPFVGPA